MGGKIKPNENKNKLKTVCLLFISSLLEFNNGKISMIFLVKKEKNGEARQWSDGCGWDGVDERKTKTGKHKELKVQGSVGPQHQNI